MTIAGKAEHGGPLRCSEELDGARIRRQLRDGQAIERNCIVRVNHDDCARRGIAIAWSRPPLKRRASYPPCWDV